MPWARTPIGHRGRLFPGPTPEGSRPSLTSRPPRGAIAPTLPALRAGTEGVAPAPSQRGAREHPAMEA